MGQRQTSEGISISYPKYNSNSEINIDKQRKNNPNHYSNINVCQISN